MNEKKNSKPGKLIAAFVFLFILYFIIILNMLKWLIILPPHLTIFSTIIYFALFIAVVLWLTYLTYKGINWARFFLLYFYIINNILGFLQFISYKFQIDLLLQYIIVHFLMVIAFLLLFSKESSSWFRQVKQIESRKNIISRKYKISSICLYTALCINILQFIPILSKKNIFVIFSLHYHCALHYCLSIIISINILFIIAIKKGSRLAGIIYIAFIILTGTNMLIYANFNNHFLSFWSIIVISIQVIAFIILFQTEIMGFYCKLIRKQKKTLSE